MSKGVKQFAETFDVLQQSWLHVLVGAVSVFAVVPMRANDLFRESVNNAVAR